LILGDETADGSIVGSFTFGREETAWKLLHLPVIGDTLTASSLPFTGLIRTGALNLVFF